MTEGEIDASSGAQAAATSGIMYEFDLESGDLIWSKALYDTMHYPQSEPFDRLEWWVSHIHPDDAMTLNEAMDKLDDPKIPNWVVDYRFRSGDGSYVLVRDRASIVRDATGKAVQLIGTLTLAA